MKKEIANDTCINMPVWVLGWSSVLLLLVCTSMITAVTCDLELGDHDVKCVWDCQWQHELSRTHIIQIAQGRVFPAELLRKYDQKRCFALVLSFIDQDSKFALPRWILLNHSADAELQQTQHWASAPTQGMDCTFSKNRPCRNGLETSMSRRQSVNSAPLCRAIHFGSVQQLRQQLLQHQLTLPLQTPTASPSIVHRWWATLAKSRSMMRQHSMSYVK